MFMRGQSTRPSTRLTGHVAPGGSFGRWNGRRSGAHPPPAVAPAVDARTTPASVPASARRITAPPTATGTREVPSAWTRSLVVWAEADEHLAEVVTAKQ